MKEKTTANTSSLDNNDLTNKTDHLIRQLKTDAAKYKRLHKMTVHELELLRWTVTKLAEQMPTPRRGGKRFGE